MNEGEKVVYKAIYITFYKMKLVTESMFAWGWGGQEEGITKGNEEIWGDDRYVHYLIAVMVLWVYIHVSKLIKFTLRICAVYCMPIIPQ